MRTYSAMLYWSGSRLVEITRMASKSFHALVLAAVLFVGGAPLALHAQDQKRTDGGPPFPGETEIAFEWEYSCPNGRGCSFNCPPQGSAVGNVTRLTIHLGTIPLSGPQKAFGIFYEFSTMVVPRGSGFSLTTGISALSCQVVGMNLDYSGPAREQPFQATR